MFTTLISASELAARLGAPQLVILDCRHDLVDHSAGRTGYNVGHIPGAVFIEMEHQASGPRRAADGSFRGRHPLPEKTDFLAVLRNAGVNDDSQVVVYDAQGGMFAARVWWMLRWLGHSAVAVLDGGLAAWQAAGQPMTAAEPHPAQGHLNLRAPLVESVDAAMVLANVQSQARLVVDARAPDRFRGENETLDPVGGHIPGARNRFFRENLEADGRFKSPAQLRAEWSAIVGDEAAHLIMQCGSGVTACHNLLALEVAGLRGAALYPGSWSEWCADPARPVAR
ncbi:sulfurtransferase [Massilia sp. TS11]|uniref:sulfurtransferase n=1 Tax=Massilia sp. TS11 TaxID=2908003 RepID=UPI001EDC502A|nr:sulfurtransferase [Massilia sp. TS11]MCG2585395.1 sulfurtransferase [Massilia sp. TS11]